MKKLSQKTTGIMAFIVPFLLLYVSSCKKVDPINYPRGTFPDSTISLAGLNSAYDDFNVDIFNHMGGYSFILFSSNRESAGEHFDLIMGAITYSFNQTNGIFGLCSEITGHPFLDNVLRAANTPGDDLGPYSLFSTSDGNEYLFLSSMNEEDNLDLYYMYNQPITDIALPPFYGPNPVTLLNSGSDDAYICFNTSQDTVYYTSDREGNFNIYFNGKSSPKALSAWMSEEYSEGTKVDGINSSANDKCPFILKNIMVFTSDRDGGYGGYDLYYSVFENGEWGAPVNFGPEVNSPYNEYRPVIGFHEGFTNNYIIFSSDRPGGKGGYDLYFKGVTIPD